MFLAVVEQQQQGSAMPFIEVALKNTKSNTNIF
jgi:hypothetical protein